MGKKIKEGRVFRFKKKNVNFFSNKNNNIILFFKNKTHKIFPNNFHSGWSCDFGSNFNIFINLLRKIQNETGRICVYTNNNFLVGTYRNVKYWEKNNWKKANGKNLKIRHFAKEIRGLFQKRIKVFFCNDESILKKIEQQQKDNKE